MKQLLKQAGKAVCYIVLFFGMQMIVTLGMMFFMAVLYGIQHANEITMLDPVTIVNDVTNQTMGAANLISAISGILAVIALILFFLIRKKNILQEMHVRSVRAGGYIWPPLLGVCLTFVVMVVLSFLPAEWISAYEESSALLVNESLLIMFIGNVIVAPIAEEVVFRGLVFSRLQKAMPTWVAVLVTSLSFAVLHGQIVWIAYAFILGVVLTSLTARYKSIVPSIMMHMTFNLFGSFFGYLPLPDLVMGGIVLLAFIAFIPVAFMAFKPEKRQEEVIAVATEETQDFFN